RLRFQPGSEGWTQSFAEPDPEADLLQVHDLSHLPEAELPAALQEGAAQVQASLHLSQGPLLRAGYWPHPGRLLIAIHHCTVDAVSWPILIEDLLVAYTQA